MYLCYHHYFLVEKEKKKSITRGDFFDLCQTIQASSRQTKQTTTYQVVTLLVHVYHVLYCTTFTSFLQFGVGHGNWFGSSTHYCIYTHSIIVSIIMFQVLSKTFAWKVLSGHLNFEKMKVFSLYLFHVRNDWTVLLIFFSMNTQLVYFNQVTTSSDFPILIRNTESYKYEFST